MEIPLRIVTEITRAPPSLLREFADIPTAIISDSANRLLASGTSMRPMHRRGRLVGSALTVRTRPGDNLFVHKALDMAEPGDVVVVDAGGDLTNAIIGELMSAYAQSRGIAGFVIDGAIRDLETIATEDFPIYATGVTHRGPYKEGPGEINVTIRVGGLVVSPGDVIIGDSDGVTSVSQSSAVAVLEVARARMRNEAEARLAIAAGSWDRTWVDRQLVATGAIPDPQIRA
jgi:regulator of RNase E activity RraA